MKYYIIAGESSGDLYGGLLMQEIINNDPTAQFQFWGGPKMKAHSSGQLKSLEETAFMGFFEVAKNIVSIQQLFKFAKYSISKFNPDIVIFIDYPGFNLRMLKWCKLKGYKTCFYISPQLWAWKKKRHHLLRTYADLFFVILPFESAFYKNLDTPCIYHGHPLLEIVPEPTSKKGPIQTVGFFPGSRKQELEKHYPLLLEFAQMYPDLKFVVAGISHLNKSSYVTELPNIELVFDDPKTVMSRSDLAMASSGTATLELALFGVPQIVIYKTSAVSFAIGKRLVKTRFISLVNIIAQKKVVEELLQEALTLENLNAHFLTLQNEVSRSKILEAYADIRKQLGNGQTSSKVAQDIYNFIDPNKKMQ